MKCISILFLFLFTGITLYGESKDFSIIKYNNPDLTVDLEVGLWPVPIPVDYDDDGLTVSARRGQNDLTL